MPVSLAGVTVDVIDAPPPPPLLTDTGTAFIAGLAERGKSSGIISGPEVFTNLADWTFTHGARQSYNGVEYDTIQAFFAEGGSRLYFSRIVGPAAVKASAAVPAVSSKFTATAKGAGSYGNNLEVSVASGVITVKENDVPVEVSPAFTDLADAQQWATYVSAWIDVTPLTTGALSDSADVALTGGTDDRTNITDTQREAALDRFGIDLGPGQLALPGDTRTAAHAMLGRHAQTFKRFAFCDAPNSPVVATIAAVGTAARNLGTDIARSMQIFGPWVRVGGDSGVQRVIPPSGIMLGLAARVDSRGNPAASTAREVSRTGLGVVSTFTDADRLTLARAGITVLAERFQVVKPIDDITPVNTDTDKEWEAASTGRLIMRVLADARAISEDALFRGVTGPRDYAAFNGALSGMLAGWLAAGALFSRDGSAADAFRVETGPSVNTPTTIANRELRAAIALRVAPTARLVKVTVTNTPVNATTL
jgi:hypothetical protein